MGILGYSSHRHFLIKRCHFGRLTVYPIYLNWRCIQLFEVNPMSSDIETLRSNFLKQFASVPGPLRRQIIAVVDNETYTWSTAYLEISNDTKKGNQILKFMKEASLL